MTLHGKRYFPSTTTWIIRVMVACLQAGACCCDPCGSPLLSEPLDGRAVIAMEQHDDHSSKSKRSWVGTGVRIVHIVVTVIDWFFNNG